MQQIFTSLYPFKKLTNISCLNQRNNFMNCILYYTDLFCHTNTIFFFYKLNDILNLSLLLTPPPNLFSLLTPSISSSSSLHICTILDLTLHLCVDCVMPQIEQMFAGYVETMPLTIAGWKDVIYSNRGSLNINPAYMLV